MEAGNNYNTVHSAYVAKTTATQTACLLHIRNGQGTVTFGHWMTSSADNAGDWIWKAQKAKDLLSGTFLSSPLVVMMLPSAVLAVLDSGLCSEVSEISLPSLSLRLLTNKKLVHAQTLGPGSGRHPCELLRSAEGMRRPWRTPPPLR